MAGFLIKICGFLAVAGMLGLVYVFLDHVAFGNDGPYPDLTEDGGDFWDYMLQVGALTLGSILLGTVLYAIFGDD